VEERSRGEGKGRECEEKRGNGSEKENVVEDLEPGTYISKWEKEEARSRDVYRTR
jgi:hypothetical protein